MRRPRDIFVTLITCLCACQGSAPLECTETCDAIARCQLTISRFGNVFEDCVVGCAMASPESQHRIHDCLQAQEPGEDQCESCVALERCLVNELDGNPIAYRRLELQFRRTAQVDVDRRAVPTYSCKQDSMPRIAASWQRDQAEDFSEYCSDRNIDYVEVGVEGDDANTSLAFGPCEDVLNSPGVTGDLKWGLYQIYVFLYSVERGGPSCRKLYGGNIALFQSGRHVLYFPSNLEFACENAPEPCVDDTDNDLDGAIDCKDPECWDYCLSQFPEQSK